MAGLVGITTLVGMTSFKPNNNTPLVTQLTDHSVRLRWTKGHGQSHTYIVMKEGSAPTSSSDGVMVYNDQGTTVDIYHLDVGDTYYFGLYGNTPSFSLSTENTVTTPETPLKVSATEQYIFVALKDGGGVQVRKRSAPGTLVETIKPTNVSTNAVFGIHARGNLLTFTAGTYMWIYEYVNDGDSTQLLEAEVGGVTQSGSHIDAELEYAYTGQANGNIVYYDIATLTKRTMSGVATASNTIRDIDTRGDQLIVCSNDDKLYDVDRSNRTSMTSRATVATFGGNVEISRLDDNYIYVGSDDSEVEIRNRTTPYAIQETLTGSSNDITGIVAKDEDYLAVASDDTEIQFYDVNDSYNIEATINKTHGIEGIDMSDGELYYSGGAEGTPATTFYYRNYYSNSISGLYVGGSLLISDI